MFYGLFFSFFFLLFQKGYAKCYSNFLISYNQNYLGQMDRQTMQNAIHDLKFSWEGSCL